MKKIIMLIMMIVSITVFGEKINTTGKSLDVIMEENKVDIGIKLFDYHWVDEDIIHSFIIEKSELDNDNNIYLTAYYAKKPNNDLTYKMNKNGYIISEKVPVEDGEDVESFVAYYKIYKTNVLGIYYVNNYIDVKGKKHSKLYFGFDEKMKKIVITDEKGNIKLKLEAYVAG